jgi:hypothetical protein
MIDPALAEDQSGYAAGPTPRCGTRSDANLHDSPMDRSLQRPVPQCALDFGGFKR